MAFSNMDALDDLNHFDRSLAYALDPSIVMGNNEIMMANNEISMGYGQQQNTGHNLDRYPNGDASQQQDGHQQWTHGPVPTPDPQLYQQLPQLQPLQPQQLAPLQTQDLNNAPIQNQYSASPTPRSTERVPLPPINKTTANHLGPMSKAPVVPPRPKPGRKPMPPSETEERRRKQNREAQRNFRDKRQQKLIDTMHELEAKKIEYEEKISQLQRDHGKEKEQIRAQCQAQIAQIEQRATAAEELLTRHGISPSPTSAAPGLHLPPTKAGSQTQGPVLGGFRPAMAWDSHEPVDFTNYGRPARRGATASRPPVSNDSAQATYSMDMQTDEGKCGFCSDPGNCICNPTPNTDIFQPDFKAGTCTNCLQDPKRQAACREIAMTAREQPSDNNVLAPMRPCSTFMDEIEESGRPLAPISQLFNGDGQFRAYASHTSGFEIQDVEAAKVLQTLVDHNNTDMN